MGAKVLNLSFGGLIIEKQMLPDSFRIIEYALTFAYDIGVVSIAAMGNGEDIAIAPQYAFYPAFSDYTLAVGATDCNDNRVKTWWQSSYSDYLPHIDLVAPGLDIETLPEGSYFNGTSASTPFVAGIASLVITHRKRLIPNEVLSAEQIYEVLRHTADDTVGHTYTGGELEDTLCWDKFYGWGRANAFKALVAVSHGDVNNDSKIDIDDINYLINYIFRGGPPPVPVSDMADANCDKKVSLSDIVFLINYVLKGGPPPSLCYTDCSQS
jgi:thermitase